MFREAALSSLAGSAEELLDALDGAETSDFQSMHVVCEIRVHATILFVGFAAL